MGRRLLSTAASAARHCPIIASFPSLVSGGSSLERPWRLLFEVRWCSCSRCRREIPRRNASPPNLEGMLSDRPYPRDTFCEDGARTRVGEAHCLLDDPPNDERPFSQLRGEANTFQRERYSRD